MAATDANEHSCHMEAHSKRRALCAVRPRALSVRVVTQPGAGPGRSPEPGQQAHGWSCDGQAGPRAAHRARHRGAAMRLPAGGALIHATCPAACSRACAFALASGYLSFERFCLVFVPAQEPWTILERKPLQLGAPPPPADSPGGAAWNLEKLCVQTEASPGLVVPERQQGTALERSLSSDVGAVTCRAWELGVGTPGGPPPLSAPPPPPPARGEHRRHTNGGITKEWIVSCWSRWQSWSRRAETDTSSSCSTCRSTSAAWARAGPTLSLGLSGAPARWGDCCPRCRRWPGGAAGCGLCLHGSALGLLRAPIPHPGPRLTPCTWLAAADHPDAQRAEPAPHAGGDQHERADLLIKQLFEERALSQQDAGLLNSTFI
ncbi:hypothetical protein QTO34_008323 [Cnephaeus nilssonii]|uniref:Uncharacterized protein n=1 Tax=Cnephaeus nilssonii TaxID=3371016 RepID=A0AA40IA87_CNENI|nr:hypothetical protein QTO34_008323 [Eptesicus nilssonii]